MAKDIWRAASSRGLDVHHRIPLEWAQLFPKPNPNRIGNLIGLPGQRSNIRLPGIQDPSKLKTVHEVVNEEWYLFKQANPNPSATGVMSARNR